MFTNDKTIQFNRKRRLFSHGASPAGVDVRADDRVRPVAEVEAIGRANGVADAAGLVNPKLKPVADADVVAGVPVQTDKQLLFYRKCAPYQFQSGSLKDRVHLLLQTEQGYVYLYVHEKVTQKVGPNQGAHLKKTAL